MNNYDMDDIPDLEDLSEEISKLRGNVNNTDSEISVKVIQEEKINPSIEKPLVNKSKEETGFKIKKGYFLKNNNSNNHNESNNSKQNQAIDLTNIKANNNQTLKGKLIENVKNEIKSTDTNNLFSNIIGKQNEWCTPDLFSKFAQKPYLLKFFLDPQFSEVIKLMQKDPNKAKELYGNNKELNEFMKEFSMIMADHFNKLGEKNLINTSGDKEVEEILNDPKVNSFIKTLQSQGKIDMNQLQCDTVTYEKIKKLIDKGILKIQRD